MSTAALLAASVAVIVAFALGNWLGLRRVADMRSQLKSQGEALAQAQARQAKLRSALKEADDDVERFAYIASHDLRAPLRAIDNLAEFLREDLADALTEESRRHLDLISSRVARLDRLLVALLEYLRVGYGTEERATADVRALAQQSVDQHLSASSKVTLTGDVGTARLARQSFVSSLGLVLENAERHTDVAEVHIQITLARSDDSISVSVRDNGPGIPLHLQQRVFDLFETLQPRDKVESSGIGLAIVEKTMRRLGGSVVLESDPEKDRGTTVTLVWPA
ncbi:MAG: ATP-binding protein [Pseudomonadota bacterium]